MPDQASSRLALPYLQAAQAQKHVTHNEALRRLDLLVQLVVADADRTVPPSAPADRDAHIVAAGATGDWAGRSGQIAAYEDGTWLYVLPRPGWRAWVVALGHERVWTGTDWIAVVAAMGRFDTLGINATADTTSRLSVSAAATLLNHDGAGHQLKLNKATAADTASLLFQTGFSGRAEMGTAGTDGFAIKVSGDGTTWSTGLSVAPATGQVALAAGSTLGGSAIYARNTVLGTVTQVSGVPTGALIERGTNANGIYTRFADGTQICSHSLTTSASGSVAWTFPAAMISSGVQVTATPVAAALRVATVQGLGATGISINGWDGSGARSAFSVGLMAMGRWI